MDAFVFGPPQSHPDSQTQPQSSAQAQQPKGIGGLPTPNPTNTTPPTSLVPGYRHVDAFRPRGQGRSAEGNEHASGPDYTGLPEGNEGHDEEEDLYESEEETIYVTLNMPYDLEPKLVPSSNTYRLIGLDTPTPYLQLQGTILQGRHDLLLGSEIIFEDDRHNPDHTKRTVSFVGMTEQRIAFREVRLVPKNPPSSSNDSESVAVDVDADASTFPDTPVTPALSVPEAGAIPEVEASAPLNAKAARGRGKGKTKTVAAAARGRGRGLSRAKSSSSLIDMDMDADAKEPSPPPDDPSPSGVQAPNGEGGKGEEDELYDPIDLFTGNAARPPRRRGKAPTAVARAGASGRANIIKSTTKTRGGTNKGGGGKGKKKKKRGRGASPSPTPSASTFAPDEEEGELDHEDNATGDRDVEMADADVLSGPSLGLTTWQEGMSEKARGKQRADVSFDPGSRPGPFIPPVATTAVPSLGEPTGGSGFQFTFSAPTTTMQETSEYGSAYTPPFAASNLSTKARTARPEPSTGHIATRPGPASAPAAPVIDPALLALSESSTSYSNPHVGVNPNPVTRPSLALAPPLGPVELEDDDDDMYVNSD